MNKEEFVDRVRELLENNTGERVEYLAEAIYFDVHDEVYDEGFDYGIAAGARFALADAVRAFDKVQVEWS